MESVNLVRSIIVSYSFTDNADRNLMIVGKKDPKKDVTIINTITGNEAMEVYKKLIGGGVEKNE